jgi:hypothetical protein
VQKVGAITIKPVVRGNSSQVRNYFKEPGKIDFPNLKLTLSEADAEQFIGWYEDFVINGNHEEEKHKTGSLTVLDRDRESELLTLGLSGLGIFKISAAPRANNEDKIASVTVEMYCEAIKVKFA